MYFSGRIKYVIQQSNHVCLETNKNLNGELLKKKLGVN